MGKIKQQGVTLTELLVVLCIMGILLGMTLPGTQNWLEDTRLRTTANQLAHDLYHARGLIINQGETIEICGMHDNRQCTSN